MSGSYPGQQHAPAGFGQQQYPESSQAVVALVLGLVGMFMFPLVAPFAWAIGSKELSAIAAGRRPPDNRQLARIGQILGIIMSVLLIVFVVLVFGILLLAVLAG